MRRPDSSFELGDKQSYVCVKGAEGGCVETGAVVTTSSGLEGRFERIDACRIRCATLYPPTELTLALVFHEDVLPAQQLGPWVHVHEMSRLVSYEGRVLIGQVSRLAALEGDVPFDGVLRIGQIILVVPFVVNWLPIGLH